jgi:serine/threonine protein kinase
MKWSADNLRFSPFTGEEYFTEDEIKKLMSTILAGLEYLHSSGIVHRDIKPANILVTKENSCKIGDFGVTMKLEDPADDTLESTEGTYHFMGPECWNFKTESRQFAGKKCDIWALGVTLFAMVYNQMPFWSNNEFELS